MRDGKHTVQTIQNKVGAEVPAPLVLRKAKLWSNSRNCWANPGENMKALGKRD